MLNLSEEKEYLEKQLEKLQAELLGFKYRALVSTTSRGRNGNSSCGSVTQDSFTESVLRDAIKIQQLSLASVQAALSTYVSHHTKVSPIETPIRLGRDLAARRQTLESMHTEKLADARTFLAERSRGMDGARHYREEERFETDEGDFCALRFDITPLVGNTSSVKKLFDALLYYIFNVEISITESFGNITIREDDDSGETSTSIHRLVTTSASGVQVEISTVHFSEFDENSHGGLGSGVIVADFIDEDELYPYRPSERVRNDLTAVMTITPERRKRNEDDNDGDDETVITVTRWSLLKLHRAEFEISHETRDALRDRLGCWWDDVLKTMRGNLAQG
uniref:Uncharacterized protein n=1 Tax=Globisporangium ultimum (strain ATCC 200006 / CBS 805.95 / DAOM BR144) TaxID=431595 RepID=K3X3B8_GLOUD